MSSRTDAIKEAEAQREADRASAEEVIRKLEEPLKRAFDPVIERAAQELAERRVFVSTGPDIGGGYPEGGIKVFRHFCLTLKDPKLNEARSDGYGLRVHDDGRVEANTIDLRDGATDDYIPIFCAIPEEFNESHTEMLIEKAISDLATRQRY